MACMMMQNGDPQNPIYVVKGGLLAKSRKLFFQGRAFLEGKIQKMQKKISKNFNVPNRLLGHQGPRWHVGHVGHGPPTFLRVGKI